jgi:hypothetical protein
MCVMHLRRNCVPRASMDCFVWHYSELGSMLDEVVVVCVAVGEEEEVVAMVEGVGVGK